MENEMTFENEEHKVAGLPAMNFGKEQIELIKRTVCKGATDDELALFLHTAKRLGLDPLARQIHAVKRWDSASNREVMAIQTGIDGYRLNAERTGKYAPGREPSFAYEGKKLLSATAYVKKFVGGQWHEVAATAHMDEYVAKKKDGSLTAMWATKPHIMLSKCAEALALRRAFPAELSGIYTDEEMQQADTIRNVTPKPHIEEKSSNPEKPTEDNPNPEDEAHDSAEEYPKEEDGKREEAAAPISVSQGKRLYAIWKSAGKSDDEVKAYILNKYGIKSTREIPWTLYNEICEWAGATNEDNQ